MSLIVGMSFFLTWVVLTIRTLAESFIRHLNAQGSRTLFRLAGEIAFAGACYAEQVGCAFAKFNEGKRISPEQKRALAMEFVNKQLIRTGLSGMDDETMIALIEAGLGSAAMEMGAPPVLSETDKEDGQDEED